MAEFITFPALKDDIAIRVDAIVAFEWAPHGYYQLTNVHLIGGQTLQVSGSPSSVAQRIHSLQSHTQHQGETP